ncbi:unnamed protein product [Rangifer tarandus platyrhynchus]|uniref:Uncharacterized protein n=2 Tax=Rangifer tarandus platyrhynchus TaxID=3082113 RepID=A0ACB0FE97_RANTA|nr:unnamed protein product [Rangifer tarandus platyrhynchus]CAI9710823.1 unnamed protein product [Rangifer tarandus platyrhynchus]
MESSWYTVDAHNLKPSCLLSGGFPQRLKEAFESSKPGRRTRRSLKVRVPLGPRVPGGAAPPADRGGGRGNPPRSAKALSRKEPLICASVAEETRRKTLWVRSPGPWVSAIGVLLELPWADRKRARNSRNRNSRTSQENGPGWSEAQAQHRISQQLLPSAGGRLIYSVRESAAWGPRGVRVWERKH